MSGRTISNALSPEEIDTAYRWILATRDAHGLYARYGFTPLENPERVMARLDQDVYTRLSSSTS